MVLCRPRPSIQLCAVTGHLSQNIAAIPLLWVLPLACIC